MAEFLNDLYESVKKCDAVLVTSTDIGVIKEKAREKALLLIRIVQLAQVLNYAKVINSFQAVLSQHLKKFPAAREALYSVVKADHVLGTLLPSAENPLGISIHRGRRDVTHDISCSTV